MKKINPKIVIAGWPHLAHLARSVIKEMEIPHWVKIEISELPLQVIADSGKSFEILKSVIEPATILISGDRSAVSFKKQIDNLVLHVKVTGFDFLQTIQESDSNEIVVLNFHQNIEEITNTAHLLKVKVRQEIYQSYSEARELLYSFQQEGYRQVIGGSWVCSEAENFDMKGIFYYSRRAMKEALNIALSTIKAYRNETEKTLLLSTIVDMNRSGIIATDQNMNITVCSPASEQLLGLNKKKLIGKPLQTIFPKMNIDRKEFENSRYDTIISQNNRKIEVEAAPIILDDSENFGVIMILEDIADLQKKVLQIRRKLNQKGLIAHYSFKDIIGYSEPTETAKETAKKFSYTNSAILIQGESGTGKELFAQSIHNSSHRSQHPFVAINCAALSENLLNSELFGYEEGAFTGAKKGGKIGLFELAHQGTIFLDEISEIALPLQTRLLRVIQEKEVMRIGGEQNIPIDVRIITATNRDLLDCVQNKTFREDLYYRIGVLQLHIPPLRDRLKDIPVLVSHYLIEHDSTYLESHIFTNDEIVSLLYAHDWPGNIRELENVMERFIVFCSGEGLEPTKLSEKIQQAIFPSKKHFLRFSSSLDTKIKTSEIEHIQQVLALCNGNKENAAKKLGISRTTLWRKLQSN